MAQVIGVEAIVAQVVVENFKGGKIVDTALEQSQLEGALADGVSVEAVGEMADGADGEDDAPRAGQGDDVAD